MIILNVHQGKRTTSKQNISNILFSAFLSVAGQPPPELVWSVSAEQKEEWLLLSTILGKEYHCDFLVIYRRLTMEYGNMEKLPMPNHAICNPKLVMCSLFNFRLLNIYHRHKYPANSSFEYNTIQDKYNIDNDRKGQ